MTWEGSASMDNIVLNITQTHNFHVSQKHTKLHKTDTKKQIVSTDWTGWLSKDA